MSTIRAEINALRIPRRVIARRYGCTGAFVHAVLADRFSCPPAFRRCVEHMIREQRLFLCHLLRLLDLANPITSAEAARLAPVHGASDGPAADPRLPQENHHA